MAEARDRELLAAYEAGNLNDAQLNIYRNPCPEEELFQVCRDPDQLTNLAQNPEHREVLKAMREQLALWTEQTGDTIPDDPTPDTPKGTAIRNAPHREMPGAAAGAEKINHPGPVGL